VSNETHGLLTPAELAARRREELDHAQARREWIIAQDAARRIRPAPADAEQEAAPVPPSLWPLLTLAILGLLVAVAVFLVS
jgi:hypothetical protein